MAAPVSAKSTQQKDSGALITAARWGTANGRWAACGENIPVLCHPLCLFACPQDMELPPDPIHPVATAQLGIVPPRRQQGPGSGTWTGPGRDLDPGGYPSNPLRPSLAKRRFGPAFSYVVAFLFVEAGGRTASLTRHAVLVNIRNRTWPTEERMCREDA